jgi:hypothetical protein
VSVTRDEIEKQMDELARKFALTHDPKVKVEIERLSSELVKLDRPWVFVAKGKRGLSLGPLHLGDG